MNIDDNGRYQITYSLHFPKQKRLYIVCFIHCGMCNCFNNMNELCSQLYLCMFSIP